MLYKNEDGLKAAIKGAAPQGVYLLYSGENYLIDGWVKKLTGSFGGGFSSFNMQRLDGAKLDCDALLDAVETLPLMAQEKCVLLTGLELSKLPAGELDKLLEIVSDVPDGCALIITGKTPGFDAKTAAAKKLIKACSDAGIAAELPSRSAKDMVTFLRATAKKHGCEMSADVARYMLGICETGMGTLYNETAKICAYAGGGEVEKRHVDAVAIPRTEARVFDLGKAITAGNSQRAFEVLHDLFFLREQPVAILSALASTYVDMYRARVAKDSGFTPADVVARFGYKGREFRVTNAWGTRMTVAGLRGALDCLYDCDRGLKSSPVGSAVLLEQTVVRLLALRS